MFLDLTLIIIGESYIHSYFISSLQQAIINHSIFELLEYYKIEIGNFVFPEMKGDLMILLSWFGDAL